MQRRLVVLALMLFAALVVGSSLALAAGRVSVRGDGTRDYEASGVTYTTTFSFSVVLKAGVVSGPFSWDNGQGLSFSGSASCGSVSGNIAVFGGQATDNFGRTYNAVFEVSDNPDGMIVGNFGSTTPCDTTGFGDPTSLPITSGSIKITGHR